MTRQVSERDWETRYNPLNAPNGSQNWEFHEIPDDTPNTRVWSYVEGEGNQLYVLSGYHTVNVEGFAVTEFPWEPPEDYEVLIEGTSDKDKVIEEIALILWYDGDERRWDKDKEWDSSTLSEVAEAMMDRGFGPPEQS